MSVMQSLTAFPLIKVQAFISLLNQPKNLVAPCSTRSNNIFQLGSPDPNSQVPVVLVILVLQIKLLYTLLTPCTKVAPPGL